MSSPIGLPPTLQTWMADVDRQLRDLATGNALNQGSVQDASGNWIPISQLAFGMVTAEYDDYVNLQGIANEIADNSVWVAGEPSLDVLVHGSRLRLDLAGTLFAFGDHCSIWMAYELFYRGPADNRNSQKTSVKAPAEVGPISTQDQTFVGSIITCGGFNLHTGLMPGWYTVEARYTIGYNPTSTEPFGNVQNPRLAATPY